LDGQRNRDGPQRLTPIEPGGTANAKASHLPREERLVHEISLLQRADYGFQDQAAEAVADSGHDGGAFNGIEGFYQAFGEESLESHYGGGLGGAEDDGVFFDGQDVVENERSHGERYVIFKLLEVAEGQRLDGAEGEKVSLLTEGTGPYPLEKGAPGILACDLEQPIEEFRGQDTLGVLRRLGPAQALLDEGRVIVRRLKF
jgi:hypothetical protein